MLVAKNFKNQNDNDVRLSIPIIWPSNPNYAMVLNNLGSTFAKMGQYEKGLYYLERCQQIKRKTIGEKHPDYASILCNLGSFNEKLGEYQKAISYFQRGLIIWRQTLGQNYPYISIVSKIISNLQSKVGTTINNFIISQIISQNKTQKTNKKEEIKVQAKNEKQSPEQTSIQYYLNICKKCVFEVSQIPNQTFEFQLYNQVLSYIKDVDIEAAVTAMQIIKQQLKGNQQLQGEGHLRQTLNELNNLITILLDFFSQQQTNFSEVFKKSHSKLIQLLMKDDKEKESS